jgi:hypothetical protein
MTNQTEGALLDVPRLPHRTYAFLSTQCTRPTVYSLRIETSLWPRLCAPRRSGFNKQAATVTNAYRSQSQPFSGTVNNTWDPNPSAVDGRCEFSRSGIRDVIGLMRQSKKSDSMQQRQLPDNSFLPYPSRYLFLFTTSRLP